MDVSKYQAFFGWIDLKIVITIFFLLFEVQEFSSYSVYAWKNIKVSSPYEWYRLLQGNHLYGATFFGTSQKVTSSVYACTVVYGKLCLSTNLGFPVVYLYNVKKPRLLISLKKKDSRKPLKKTGFGLTGKKFFFGF